jgi:hypothetical protein
MFGHYITVLIISVHEPDLDRHIHREKIKSQVNFVVKNKLEMNIVACSTDEKGYNYIQHFGGEILKERDPSEDLGVVGV